MSTLVIRNPEAESDPGHIFHRLHKSIPWPDGAISANRDRIDREWQFTTKAGIRAEKKKKMEQRLWLKREYKVTKRVPLYVWVFWCPGINNFFFRGWWTYLIGRGISEVVSESRYVGESRDLEIMELFPLIHPRLFGEYTCGEKEKWRIKFAKRYQRGLWCSKPQGKAPVLAEVEGTRIIRILGRIEWPSNNKLKGE